MSDDKTVTLVEVDGGHPLDLSGVPAWARSPAPAGSPSSQRLAKRYLGPDVGQQFTGVPSPLRARQVARLAAEIDRAGGTSGAPASKDDLRALAEILVADGGRTRAQLRDIEDRTVGVLVDAVRDEWEAVRDALDAVPALPAPAPAPVVDAAWLSTADAASALGVDRAALDRLAESACGARPDVVVRVGDGQTRRSYRWRSDALGEAVAAARQCQTPAPSRSRKRTLRQASKAQRGSKLSSLVD